MSLHAFIGNLPQYAVVAVVFVAMISVLVFAHELGHYLFARLFNMGVEEFAIGFGKKPIWIYGKREYVIPVRPGEIASPTLEKTEWDASVNASGLSSMLEGGSAMLTSVLVEGSNGPELHETTHFTIRPIPAGGFVRIKGMIPEGDGSETKIPGGFYSKSPWQRFIVLLAGPAFSVLAGILILVPVLMADGISKLDNRPILGAVEKKTPAALANLQKGDVILAVDGQKINRFYDMIQIVRRSPGVKLDFLYQRGSTVAHTFVTPVMDSDESAVLDESLNPTGDFKLQAKIYAGPLIYTVYPSFRDSLAEAVQAPIDTIVGIARVFEQPSLFRHSVSGPAQMVDITDSAVKQGVLRVLELMAYLSISVGIFNLLPFPPLDGGQMAIAIAEMIRGGRRLSIRIQELVTTAGFLAVFVLMISALYVDFRQLTKPQKEPALANPETKPATRPAAASLSSKTGPAKTN